MQRLAGMAWDAHVKQGPGMSERSWPLLKSAGALKSAFKSACALKSGGGAVRLGGGALKHSRRVEGGLSALQPEGGVAAHREKRPRFLAVDEDRKGRA